MVRFITLALLALSPLSFAHQHIRRDGHLHKRVLNKSPLYTKGLSPIFDPALRKVKSAKAISHRVDPANVTAAQHGQAAWCPRNALRVYMVRYTDCAGKPIPFITCKQKPANGQTFTTVKDAIRIFGRIPAGERSYVAAISLLPTNTGSAHAFTEYQHLAFFGDFNGSPSVFIHETGHAVDVRPTALVLGSPTQLPPFAYFASTSTWANAIANDSCVPDAYSATNEVEDWAQNNVLAVYANRVTSQLPQPTPSSSLRPSCLRNQHSRALSHLSSIKAFATTCHPSIRSKVASVQRSLDAQPTPWSFPKPTAAAAAAAAVADKELATPSAQLHALQPTPA